MNKITEFLDSIREKRKWAEEGVRNVQTQLRSAHKRMAEVKKGYEAKCKEEINANHQYHQVRKTTNCFKKRDYDIII